MLDHVMYFMKAFKVTNTWQHFHFRAILQNKEKLSIFPHDILSRDGQLFVQVTPMGEGSYSGPKIITALHLQVCLDLVRFPD